MLFRVGKCGIIKLMFCKNNNTNEYEETVTISYTFCKGKLTDEHIQIKGYQEHTDKTEFHQCADCSIDSIPMHVTFLCKFI